MLIHLKTEDFNKEIINGTVVVDFYADWCGPCQMLSPVIEELASERSNAKFIKVNVDEQQELAKQYGVMSIPTIIVFKNGKIKNTNVGFVPKEIIQSWIEE